MLTFSYTVSPFLKLEIEKIEKIRREILVELVPTATDIQLRWEAGISRAIHGSRLTENKLKRIDVVRSADKNSYISAYRHLNHNWFLNSEKATFQDVKKLYSFFGKRINLNEKDVNNALDFIQVNPEHPIIQAGVALVLLSNMLPQDSYNILSSIPLASLFLYKHGFDFRGLLDIEEYLSNDKTHFSDLLKKAREEENLSRVLEYFAEGVLISAEFALRRVKEKEFKKDMPSYFYILTERQKEVMAILDNPGAKVTNKMVQKKFGVSQITASRDLSKMLKLGVIYANGKGRSIYYTKA
jgi:DNA-binding transcriptional ArsR family regulator